MKKYTYVSFVLAIVLIVSGCSPNKQIEQEPTVTESPKLVTIEIPSGEATYRTVLPYVASKSKGTVVSSSTRLDLDRQELGLLELAQTQFSPDQYLFQEGQYVSADDAEDWLARYDSEKNRLGLNPPTGSNELIHILEHNFLKIENKELGGIAIGLAISSISKNAEDKEVRLTNDELRAKVQELSLRIIERIREKGVVVPILIAGYALEPSNSVLPGNYINFGLVNENESVVSNWNSIDERHVLYPGRKSVTEKEQEIGARFSDFQKEVQAFFPQYASVTGLVRFISDEPREMTITVRASYSSRTEVTAFTQFVAGLITDYFSDDIKVYVYIESANQAEAIYVRPIDGDPFFHVYR